MIANMVVRFSFSIGTISLLSACGGGSSGVAGIPAPPPIMTNYSYTRTVDLPSASHQLTTSFLRTGRNLSNPQIVPVDQGLTISYDKASGSYSLTSPVDGASRTFIASERSTTTGINHEAYVHVSGGEQSVFSLSRGPGILLTYTMFGTWHDADNITGAATGRFFVTGAATKTGDLPTGSATYTLKAAGTAVDPTGNSGYDLAAQSTVSMTVNFQAGQVNTSLTLIGTPTDGSGGKVDFGTYSGTGSIATATATYNGQLSGNNGSGAFTGGFFGPQAIETGYVWSVAGDTFRATGNASGRRD